MITRQIILYSGGSESGIDITLWHETTSMNKLTIEYIHRASAQWVSLSSQVRCWRKVPLTLSWQVRNIAKEISISGLLFTFLIYDYKEVIILKHYDFYNNYYNTVHQTCI